MTDDDIASTRAEIAALATAFRDISATGRTSLAAVAGSARDTRAELSRTTDAGKALSRSLSTGLNRAFTAALKDGAKLSDVLRGLALDVSRSLASRAIGGLTDTVSGAVGQGIGGLFGFSKGAAFDAGNIRAFARGGVVGGPTLFPMANGVGLMGEAGPEAILPLRRGPDGSLGVAGGGGQATPITLNVTTPDADSFRRSSTQVAATLARAVDKGRRNL